MRTFVTRALAITEEHLTMPEDYVPQPRVAADTGWVESTGQVNMSTVHRIASHDKIVSSSNSQQ